MGGPFAIGYAAIGAVLVMASLFGFNILAERLFVTRKEWDMFRQALKEQHEAQNKRSDKLESAVESGFSRLNERLDTALAKSSKDG